MKTSTYLVTNKKHINSTTLYIARETQIVSKLSRKQTNTHCKKDNAIKEIKRMRSKGGSHSKQLQNKIRSHRNLGEIMLQISASQVFMESFSSTAQSEKMTQVA